MSIKDLFDVRIKTFQNQHDNLNDASVGVESTEYIKEKQKQKKIYVPPVDFSTASNFAKYGSAELYYEYAFKRIYNHYPYDGTLAEKVEFENESTHLDRYIFEYTYPRTNGYINLGYQGLDGTITSGWNDADTKEYIFVFGGIHTASGGMTGKLLADTFDKSNIYDVSNGAKKGTSLEFTSVSGSTIEFWLKKDAFDATKATKEVIFDFWNQETEGDATYGRILLNIDNSNNFTLTWNSGSTTGTSNIAPASLTIADSIWHHYAVSLKKDSSNMTIKFYQDGTLQKTTTNANGIGNIEGLSKGLCATIGALNTAPVGVGTLGRGDGKFSGSMDEFRYWKKELTPQDIGLNWFNQVGGGTNKHSYNKELGLYFKFNEGITGTSQDSVVLDYSGRIANGVWTGYVSGARNTGSAMVLSGKAKREFKDPIMYSYHPLVSAKETEMKTSGSIQDAESTSMVYHLMPSWVIEQDEDQGKNLKYLCQIVASYFDTAQAQIGAMNSIRDMTYSTGSLAPNVFSNDVLRERGFVMPNMFMESSLIENFRSKDRNEIFERDIEKVKNIIYQNIYNNINYIYKTKGTEKSYRNLFRCVGFDTELVKVNMYCDNSTLLVEDRYEYKSVVKPVVKFNAVDNTVATIYQSSSTGVTCITGSGGDAEEYTSFTLEADFILPKKLKQHETGYFRTSFLSASVVGFHSADSTNHADYTWRSDDTMRIYAVRDYEESEHVKFVLTGSGIHISSSLYRMAYDNQKWLLAARLKHENYPYAGITGSDSNSNYIVEFYGINTNGSYVDNGPFLVTASINNTAGKSFLGKAKRIYAGARRTNFTGSVLEYSDIHLSQVRYWQSYIDDETLKQHSFDSVNYGVNHSLRTDSIFATPSLNVPRFETLALHWDFGAVTGSDASGNFIVSDRSSGSVSQALKYSFIGNITNRLYEGKGDFFPASTLDVVDKANIYSAKRKPAESAYSSDGVKIIGNDQEAFFQDDDRNDIYFSFEKSPYGAISDEMVNMFATIKDFSNFVGLPVNRYRSSYKVADNLRQLFFEKVTNVPDPQRYFEYFKWIDTSVSYAVSQLMPASTRVSDSIKNIVESHVLERNKFTEKYPLTTENVPQVFNNVIGAAGSRINWAISHAPEPASPIPNDKHCVWQKIRRRFSEAEPEPMPISAPGIDTLRQVIHQNNIDKGPTLYNNEDDATYEGSTYVARSLNKIYGFDSVLQNTIHSGINYYSAKKRDLVYEIVRPHGPKNSFGVPTNVAVMGTGKGQGLVSQVVCEDSLDPNHKEKYDFQAVLGEYSKGEAVSALTDKNEYKYHLKGIMALPMNFMSQSVSGGYADAVNKKYKSKLVISNLHSDTIDNTNDIPMQGPFTETWVGGHQSRHVRLNRHNTSLRDDETGKGTFPYSKSTATAYLYTAKRNHTVLPADADAYFTLQDADGNTKTFEFDFTADTLGDGVTAGRVAIVMGADENAYKENLINAINSSLSISASFHATHTLASNWNRGAVTINSGTEIYVFKLVQTKIGTDGNTTIVHGASTAGSYFTNSDLSENFSGGNISYKNIDNLYTRPEAWRMLIGEHSSSTYQDGALGFVPPDYGVSTNLPTTHPMYGKYPDIAKKRATFYREEKAKRPVNVRHIQHDTASFRVGNYNKKYEVLCVTGRMENKFHLRENSEITLYLPTPIDTKLPHTTHIMTLIGKHPSHAGNVFGQHTNNMQPDGTVITPGTDGTPADGSFTITASNTQGTSASGKFTITGSTVLGSTANGKFAVSGSTVTGSYASGSFIVTGSTVTGSTASGSFTVYKPPIYAVASGSFRVKSKDFVVKNDELRISQPASNEDFVIESAVGGHMVATGSSIASFYNTLRTKITTETIYTATTYSETVPDYGVGLWSNKDDTSHFVSGAFSAGHWSATGPWSAAFWFYNSSSTAQDGILFTEPSRTAGVPVLRRISLSSSQKIVYEKFFSASSGPSPIILTWTASLGAEHLDRWTHVVIRQPSVASTSGDTAVPDVRFQLNDDEELDPVPLESTDADSITSIPVSNDVYYLYSDTANVGFKGGIDEFALWNVLLDTNDGDVLYNNNLYLARTDVSSSDLKLWLRCGDDWTRYDSSEDVDSSGYLSNNDIVKDQTANAQHGTASMTAQNNIELVESIYETQGSALYTVKGGATGTGSAYEGTISIEQGSSFTIVDSTISSSILTSNAVVDGHTVTIDGTTFELDSNSSVAGGNTSVAFSTNQNASAFWNVLSQSIKVNTVYDTISIDASTNSAIFHITSSTTGSSLNGDILNPSASFFSITNTDGGTNQSGSSDNDTLTISLGSPQVFRLQNDGGSSGDNDVVCGNTINNTQFWNNLSASIKSATSWTAVSYTDNGNGTATFHLTASTTGSSNNVSISETGDSFSSTVAMQGGTDETLAGDGHTITIGGVTFELDNNSSVGGGNISVTCGNTITNTQFWNNLSQSIIDNTVFDTVTYAEEETSALFFLTSSTTGSALNVSITSVGDSFSLNAFSGIKDGTDESGAYDGHTVVIGGVTFELDNNSSVSSSPTLRGIDCSSGVSNTDFWNALSQSIKDYTDYDTITITPSSDQAVFELTSSTTGSALNGDITTSGASFLASSTTSGGTNESDAASDGDTIVIDGVTFELDTNSSVSDTPTLKGIDCGAYIPNTDFWNNLSQSIKDNTVYDIITITPSSNEAVFELTSSTTGSALNVSITETETSFYGVTGMQNGSDEIPATYSSDTVLAIPGRNKDGDNSSNETIIASRFAAPGGPEIECPGYLDVYFRERSVHNALPYRNLTVRGNSSGEATSIRLNTHLTNREGLKTFLTRHCGKFGIDSKYGAVTVADYNASASYFKQHRNTSKRYSLTGAVGSTAQSTVLVSRHDNSFLQSTLPRSDFQYGWINSAVSGSEGWRRNHNVTGYAPYGGIMQEKTITDVYASFQSANSYINIGTSATWDRIVGSGSSNNNLSIGMWTIPALDSSWRYGVSLGHSMQFYWNGAYLYFSAKWNGGNKAVWRTDNQVLSLGEWNHILVNYRFDATNWNPAFYVNGVLIDSADVTESGTAPASSFDGVTPPSSGNDMCLIGNSPWALNQDFNGYIDNVAIWSDNTNALEGGSTARNTAVSNLYSVGRKDLSVSKINQHTPNSTLQAFYKLGQNHKPDDIGEVDNSSNFYDSAGNNHSLSASNVSIIEEYSYKDTYPITFPSASEIFGE